jgi:hypothetical protein
VETIHLTITEMLAGELEDYRMYEYKGMEFFPANNQLWNLSKNGRFCRVIFQRYKGEPRWAASSKLYAAGGESCPSSHLLGSSAQRGDKLTPHLPHNRIYR